MTAAPPLPVREISDFDLEGFLFVNFPIKEWVRGRARATLERMIRDAGYDEIDWSTMLSAVLAARMKLTAGMTAEQLEAKRLHDNPELTARYPPYYKSNGGSHGGENWEF